ncbi:transposase [Elysia marginata]|uniref:Transposase n=1 Tax=Elysia marginata TaxID=1093978 RepID=A0AAV4FIB8_9GAST|nr:transposase [Elysia marginata]
MAWKHPSYPVTKKFKVQSPTAKMMAIVFWDAKVVILLDILPQAVIALSQQNGLALTAFPYVNRFSYFSTF